MQLEDLKSAWRQHKLVSSLEPVSSDDILAIIEPSDMGVMVKIQRVMLHAALFAILIMFCQADGFIHHLGY